MSSQQGGGCPLEQTTDDPGGTTIVAGLGGGLSLLPKLMQPLSARVRNSGTNRARRMELLRQRLFQRLAPCVVPAA